VPRSEPAAPNNSSNNSSSKTVQRSGGGTTWTDSTLLEWDPAHFRIFVGNLAGEVTDESLLKAFSQYPSVQKARVVREKRTTKSKGYGFVSFADGDDYFRAAREQNGKYVGSHPIIVKKAVTDVRATTKQNNHRGKGGAGGREKVQHGGVSKKQPKTKGGLKVLG
jgi:RNA recognition motif-containing protein